MLYQGLTVFLALLAICKGADIHWQARVKTTDVTGAGTQAGVFIQITGQGERNTAHIQLDSDGYRLEQGRTDTFFFNAQDVGAPTKIRVWHDNTGGAPGWSLDWIELTSPNGEYPGTYDFMCECWLATDQLEYGIQRTMQVATLNWVARVTTSSIDGAGSGTFLWMTMSGDKGTTRKIVLETPADDLERGQTDVFPIKTIDVGVPTKITLHTAHNNDWHLDKVVLENMDGEGTYTFNCDCWMGRPGKTIKEIKLEYK